MYLKRLLLGILIVYGIGWDNNSEGVWLCVCEYVWVFECVPVCILMAYIKIFVFIFWWYCVKSAVVLWYKRFKNIKIKNFIASWIFTNMQTYMRGVCVYIRVARNTKWRCYSLKMSQKLLYQFVSTN